MNTYNFYNNDSSNINCSSMQTIGLCPLLIISNNALNSLELGVVIALMLIFTNIIVALTSYWILNKIRIPIIMIIIVTVTSITETLISKYELSICKDTNKFILLTTGSCLLIKKAEEILFLQKKIISSIFDSLKTGCSIILTFFCFGSFNELLSNEFFLKNSNHISSNFIFNYLHIKLFYNSNFSLIKSPVGLLISLGFFLAIKRIINNYINMLKL